MAEIRAGGDMPAAKQALLAQMLGELGQTPQGRNHVEIAPAPKSPNRFADS